MPRLGVNIDHIATLRQVRGGVEPEPVFAALVCQNAGADSIVAHLREDRRHINDRDISLLRETVKTKLNMEMSVADDIVRAACRLKPDQATLVPERRQEVTTEGGLDVIKGFAKIRAVATRLKGRGIGVSLFIDPEKRQIDAAIKAGVNMIELHTGRYADARGRIEQDRSFDEIIGSVRYARSKGCAVFAGHGLNYFNVSRIAGIGGIEELNIGYAIICRAAIVGLEQAVRQMIRLIEKP